jgi:hypothetical protein
VVAGLPPIWFYIPAGELHDRLPKGLREYRAWANEAHAKKHFWGVGKFNWILQTWFHLAGGGFPCGLITRLPDEGIVIGHRHFLPDRLQPSARQYLVCVLADKEEPGNVGRHPFAQTHLVQNPRDPMLGSARHASYVPFWTQLDLIPRSAARGDRFEHLGFFGIPNNLADELKQAAWLERLRARGLTFTVVPRERWHDYAEVDAVVAIRSFGPETYHYKPATKLHNAWHAGVPAIVGQDSAYAAERRSEVDYLEARTVDELDAAIDRLAASPDLRRRMAENGRVRAEETSDARIAARWRAFLTEELAPRYHAWRALSDGERAAELARGVS